MAMDMKALKKVWAEVEGWKRCGGCPLRKKSEPLLFKPQRPVNVMVITEGPNRVEDRDFIASLANHPTYTYLTALSGGKFIPEGESANVYWTHVRKCFVKNENGEPLSELDKNGKIALAKCWKAGYLNDEIKAGPELIVAVGKRAKRFLAELVSSFEGDLKDVFIKQIKNGELPVVEIYGKPTKAVVVPHPSPRSRFWARPPKGAKEVLETVKDEFVKAIV